VVSTIKKKTLELLKRVREKEFSLLTASKAHSEGWGSALTSKKLNFSTFNAPFKQQLSDNECQIDL